MNAATHGAAVRLRSRLINIRKADRPGMVSVNRDDLYVVLAELDLLSNGQMARYLIKIVLAELSHLPQHAMGKS
ncbi:hypothetical protein D9M68_548110 [compost metagenome]